MTFEGQIYRKKELPAQKEQIKKICKEQCQICPENWFVTLCEFKVYIKIQFKSMIRLHKIQNHLSVDKKQISRAIKPHLKEILVYENYLHSFETRPQDQIKKTTALIKQLTQKNLKRVESIKSIPNNYWQNKAKNCIFICLHGIPAMKNEFQFLNLPAKSYFIISTGFQSDKSEEDRMRQLPQCRFSIHADKIHKIFLQNPDKEVIFVYHSFGTYHLSVYFHKYGVQRVKGLIQIGAAPIRHYLYITEMFSFMLKYTQEDLNRNTDQIAGKQLSQLMARLNKEMNIKWDKFPSPSYGASFLSYFKSNQCPILFDLNRRFPNVLKLMIIGEQDQIFQADLLAQRCDFYSMQNLKNQASLSQKYKQKYGVQASNIQQNFIFMVPEGKHSLHMQKRHKPLIQKLVHQYLDIILD